MARTLSQITEYAPDLPPPCWQPGSSLASGSPPLNSSLTRPDLSLGPQALKHYCRRLLASSLQPRRRLTFLPVPSRLTGQGWRTLGICALTRACVRASLLASDSWCISSAHNRRATSFSRDLDLERLALPTHSSLLAHLEHLTSLTSTPASGLVLIPITPPRLPPRDLDLLPTPNPTVHLPYNCPSLITFAFPHPQRLPHRLGSTTGLHIFDTLLLLARSWHTPYLAGTPALPPLRPFLLLSDPPTGSYRSSTLRV